MNKIKSSKELITYEELFGMKVLAAMNEDEFEDFLKFNREVRINELEKHFVQCALKYSGQLEHIILSEKDIERMAEILSKQKLKELAYKAKLDNN